LFFLDLIKNLVKTLVLGVVLFADSLSRIMYCRS